MQDRNRSNPRAEFVGGQFQSVAGVPAFGLAMLRGGQWSSVGGGTSSELDRVLDLEVHREGAVERLYLCGDFDFAGNTVVTNLAAWDGLGFSDVGGGVGGNGAVAYALESHVDGAGVRELHVGRPAIKVENFAYVCSGKVLLEEFAPKLLQYWRPPASKTRDLLEEY